MITKASYFLGLLLVCIVSFGGKAKEIGKKSSPIIELKFDGKSFVFSKIAKPGKVSIFILSTAWCPPCQALKSSFEEAYRNSRFNSKDLDVYYCSLSGDKYNDFEELNKNKGYLNFKEVDQLTADFPTSYIVTPTTNCYTVVKGDLTDHIFKILDDLIARRQKYFTLENLQVDASTSGPKQDGKLVDSLRNKIDTMQRSIKLLNQYISLRRKIDVMQDSARLLNRYLDSMGIILTHR